MNQIHLSLAQYILAKRFQALTTRPTPKEYDNWCKQMKTLDEGKKPKRKAIRNVTEGFESNEVRLSPEFNAHLDLPTGWAVSSCYDSGGNYKVESAGQRVLRDMYNTWSPTKKDLEACFPDQAPKPVDVVREAIKDYFDDMWDARLDR